MLTQNTLKERLAYDPLTGVFRARVKRKKLNVGDVAGCWTSKGYWRIKLDNREYSAHRLAWFYVHGRWPTRLLDHENKDRGDNRIGNLREAEHFENSQNLRRALNNTSGCTGVSFDKRTGKWQASIVVRSRYAYLGQFLSIDLAAAAYAAAKKRFHTFHPTTNGSTP